MSDGFLIRRVIWSTRRFPSHGCAWGKLHS